MSIKCKVFGGFVTVALLSCGGNRIDSNQDEVDLLLLDSIPADTLTKEEDELSLNEENAPALDGVFNDFLFAYLHSRTI